MATTTPPYPSAPPSAAAKPTSGGDRILALDVLRGFALFGVLMANIATFNLVEADVERLEDLWLSDPVVIPVYAVVSVLVFNKMMALFSLLFGAGVYIVAERLTARGIRPAKVHYLRAAVLIGLGALHTVIWEGDILLAYGLLALILFPLRHLPPVWQIGIGLAAWLWAPLAELAVGFGSGDEGLSRAFAMMMIGMALYRWSVITGGLSPQSYRRLGVGGLAVGVPLVVTTLALDFHPDAFNNIGVLFVSGAYIALVMWLVLQGRFSSAASRLASAGRLSLTNYLSHTLIGTAAFAAVTWRTGELPSPTVVIATAAAITAFQLWASPIWLRHFRFGPAEWLVRSVAYRSAQPIRRT